MNITKKEALAVYFIINHINDIDVANFLIDFNGLRKDINTLFDKLQKMYKKMIESHNPDKGD
jgi:hypothetical protein